jgi:parallel beta-helix repeat protein
MGDAQKEIGMNNLVTCLVVSVMSGAAFATTWTVDDDGKADFDNIQEAVDAASDGDEILVMPGTYTSTADEVVNMLGKAVWLHSSDGPDVTIIDGQDARRGITCESQETGETIIEGLTITGGRTFGEAHPDNSGGGMICHGAHPSLKDCTFTNNTAWSRGGGLYGINGGDTLTGCTFTDNNAQRGGAIFFISLNPTLDGCTFTNNTATIDGGGILSFNANSIMTNCTFSGNTVTGVAGKGGGVCTSSPENSPSSPIFEYCTFESNAADLGGGMHNGNYSSAVLINCTFAGNFATDNGGGMLNNNNSPTLENCTFTGNTASNRGGGMHITGSSNLALTNCTFENNIAYSGGGMCNEGFSPTISNCTFTDNTANYEGGGMSNFGGSPTLTNCTFEGNSADSNGGGVYINNSSPSLTGCTFTNNTTLWGGGMYNHANSETIVISCEFTNNTAANTGGGIFTWSPPTLTNTIVCGNTSGQIWGEYTDGGGNTIAGVCPLDCPDINGDGYVGITDLLAVIDVWGCSDCIDEDVNLDGIVNRDDLVIVIASWGACP